MFKSDFRIVADYFVQIRKKGTYKGNTDDMDHVYEVLELLSVMEHDDRFIKAYYVKEGERRIRNMCDVLDRIENKGYERAKKEVDKAKKDADKAKKDADKARKEADEVKKQMEEQKEEYAKKMLAEGMKQTVVAKIIGLSKAKVAKLAKAVAAATL